VEKSLTPPTPLSCPKERGEPAAATLAAASLVPSPSDGRGVARSAGVRELVSTRLSRGHESANVSLGAASREGARSRRPILKQGIEVTTVRLPPDARRLTP
jgi:hypothetical protein